MATIAELDEKIQERKEQIARFEKRKKALLAKEREQEKKWKTAALTTMGELLLEALGCSWAELDLADLGECLSDQTGSIRELVVHEGRTPSEAKRALDEFKRARSSSYRGRSDTSDTKEDGSDDSL